MGRTKLQLEFLFKASPNILYTFLTTPACIVRWFCDKAEVDEHQITYSWSGNEEVALILADHEEEVLRLKWADSDYESEYLEFKISESLKISSVKETNSEDAFQFPLKEAREKFEKNYLEIQLNRHNGNVSKTADYIGMERSALHRKLKSLGIN